MRWYWRPRGCFRGKLIGVKPSGKPSQGSMPSLLVTFHVFNPRENCLLCELGFLQLHTVTTGRWKMQSYTPYPLKQITSFVSKQSSRLQYATKQRKIFFVKKKMYHYHGLRDAVGSSVS